MYELCALPVRYFEMTLCERTEAYRETCLPRTAVGALAGANHREGEGGG